MNIYEVSPLCFSASYTVALGLESLHLLWPRRIQRYLAIAFGAAGLLAHTLFLIFWHPPLSSAFGSLVLLTWVLAVFYLYGTVHHRKVAWAIFVLPVVIGLVILARLVQPIGSDGKGIRPDETWLTPLWSERVWGMVHGALLILAAVGVCVAFVASVMYLVQARRLKAKLPPGEGMRLMSLERLEEMNRRAINLAFPLFTAGVLLGLALLLLRFQQIQDWRDLKIVATLLLWPVFPVLLYLRYGFHLRGRGLAVLTIVAFALLVVTLAASHSLVPGGRS